MLYRPPNQVLSQRVQDSRLDHLICKSNLRHDATVPILFVGAISFE